MTESPILTIDDLQVRRDNRVVAEIPRLEIGSGEVVAIMGPNGAGKSSVLLALSLLVPASWRRYELMGRHIDPKDSLSVRRQIATVFQDPLLLEGDVLWNATLGQSMRGVPAREAEQIAVYWLERLGVEHLKHRHFRALSGGEAQRVSIARALALKPQVLLLDEPFSSLDVMSRISLMKDLRPLVSDASAAAILVTHDFSEAVLLADRMLVMEQGNVVQAGTPKEILRSPEGKTVSALVQFAQQVVELTRD